MSNAFWEARYREAAESDSLVWSQSPNAWIADVTAELEPGTAVDLGAGEGRNALWLASRGWRVTAVDFAPAGLAIGRGIAEREGLLVDWEVADATLWQASAPVDLVVIAYLQLGEDALAAALANAVAALAPGGTLAVIAHDRDNIERGVGGPQDPAMLVTVAQLERAAIGLDVVECRQYDRVTTQGTAIDAILLARAPLAGARGAAQPAAAEPLLPPVE